VRARFPLKGLEIAAKATINDLRQRKIPAGSIGEPCGEKGPGRGFPGQHQDRKKRHQYADF
jgi:hypothetical protein